MACLLHGGTAARSDDSAGCSGLRQRSAARACLPVSASAPGLSCLRAPPRPIAERTLQSTVVGGAEPRLGDSDRRGHRTSRFIIPFHPSRDQAAGVGLQAPAPCSSSHLASWPDKGKRGPVLHHRAAARETDQMSRSDDGSSYPAQVVVDGIKGRRSSAWRNAPPRKSNQIGPHELAWMKVLSRAE